MNSIRLSRSRLEQAIAAYITLQKSLIADDDVAKGVVESIPVLTRKGEIDDDGKFKLEIMDDVPLPCYIISCPRAQTAKNGSMGYPICELHIIIMGNIDPGDDNVDVKTLSEIVVGWVAQLFSEDNFDVVIAGLNAPDEGEDTRVVKQFRIFGYVCEDETSQETDRHWIDDLSYTVHCQPTDDTTG